MAEVTMPRLSDTMEEGTIAAWLKKPGEQINKGDVIAQIETDKATMDLTAFEAGTLQEILAPEGATVAIGQPVARIGSGDGSSAKASATATAESRPAETASVATPAPADNTGQAARGESTAEAGDVAAATEMPGRRATGAVEPRTAAAKENVGEAPEPTAPASEQPTVTASGDLAPG